MSKYTPRKRVPSHVREIEAAFSEETLARVCESSEADFADEYDLDTFEVDQPGPENWYHFRDHGSNILAVAHLDTIGRPHQRAAHFVDTEAGPVVYSRALDDRLGAYIILDLLPKLGIQFDILLTTGEESGKSTAAFFEPPKQYDWIIEFDRGGTDVVLYQYDDVATRELVRNAGARVGDGIFSDISYLDHLGVKGINWGVAYEDYHTSRAHAYLDDTFEMVSQFINFHEQNKDSHLPHEDLDEPDGLWGNLTRYGRGSEDADLPYGDLHALDEEEWGLLQDRESF